MAADLDDLLASVPDGETPDLTGAFPRLDETRIQALAELGERRPVGRGEILIPEGRRDHEFRVVLTGLAAVVEAFGTPVQRVVRVHGPGRFLGELGLLTGQVAFFTTVVVEPGEVIVVPDARFRQYLQSDPAFGDEILRVFLVRRSLAIGEGLGFRIIGSRYSADTRVLREFAARNRLPYRYIDLETDAAAESLLRELGISPAEIPVVVLRDQVLRNPDVTELAAMTGLRSDEPVPEVSDLIVVGAGPAGLAAAVYGASEGLTTVILDGAAPGGQAATSSRIENYLGFPAGISGGELAERAVLQTEKFGARMMVPAEAMALEQGDGYWRVRLRDGSAPATRGVVIATGARYRRLPVPRLEEFEGTSVFYAATLVEARVCTNDPVVVVGGGNSAGQAALYLACHASAVKLVVREHSLDEYMSRYLADRILTDSRIGVLVHTEVCELVGEHSVLEAVVVADNESGERRTLPARELMVFIGAEPCTSWLAGSLALDSGGYVLTGKEAVAARIPSGMTDGTPMLLGASAPGVFAVGDVRSGSVKRVASAVGEGAMAVRMVHEHLASTQ